MYRIIYVPFLITILYIVLVCPVQQLTCRARFSLWIYHSNCQPVDLIPHPLVQVVAVQCEAEDLKRANSLSIGTCFLDKAPASGAEEAAPPRHLFSFYRPVHWSMSQLCAARS